MPVVCDQLHELASRSLRAEDRNHSPVATALVNEAYLRLVDANVNWQDRIHFFAVSARLLRRILVDYARASHRQKRGGNAEMVPLEEAIAVGPDSLAGVPELVR
jgi:RNA polymerase sigma-70 factor, ECF subfamily